MVIDVYIKRFRYGIKYYVIVVLPTKNNKKGGEIGISMSRRKREKVGSGVLVSGVVICIAAAFISSLAIPVLTAQQTEDTVKVRVNAPEMVNT